MPSAEEKLYSLASSNATMQADLGNPIRWSDRQLAPGFIQPSTPPNSIGASCVRVRRISTLRRYVQGNGAPTSGTNLSPLSFVRFQIDVLDYNAEIARQVAADVVAFLGTVCLSSNAQFNSPATTPNQFPSFLLSQRAGMDFELSSAPVYVESLDCRLYNLENLN